MTGSVGKGVAAVASWQETARHVGFSAAFGGEVEVGLQRAWGCNEGGQRGLTDDRD